MSKNRQKVFLQSFQMESVNKLCLICAELCFQFYILCFTSPGDINKILCGEGGSETTDPYFEFFPEYGVYELCLICAESCFQFYLL